MIPRTSQRGVAAISLAALLVAISALLLVSQREAMMGSEASRVEGQINANQWAENAINAFAFAHGRLPCPADVQNGPEVCDGRPKGWLPVSTLENDNGDLVGAQRRQPVSYIVYKGSGEAADPDLTRLSEESFQPKVNGTTTVPGYDKVKSLADLCQKLQDITGNLARAKVDNEFASGRFRDDRAAVTYTYSGPAKNVQVAYAIASAQFAKPTDSGSLDPGESEEKTSVNFNMKSLILEPPDRPQTQKYSERVLGVQASNMFTQLGCASVMISLDAIATASAFTSLGVGARDGNIIGSNVGIWTGSFFVGIDAFLVREAQIDMEQAAVLAAENTALAAMAASGVGVTSVAYLNYLKGKQEASAAALSAAKVTLIKSLLSAANSTAQLAYKVILKSSVDNSTVWSSTLPLIQAADDIDKLGGKRLDDSLN